MEILLMKLSLFKYFAIVILAFFISGCASTWVEKSPEFTPEKQKKTITCYYEVSGDSGADVFDLAKQGAGGKSFADVGMNTYKLLEKALEKYNLNLVTDRSRTRQLDTITKDWKELDTGNDSVNKLVGSLSQEWVHPDTSDVPFHRYSDNLVKKAVNKIKRGNNELFLAANLKIEDQDQYLVFKRFRLILSVKVINSDAETVFQARSQGFTKMAFLRNPISAERIETAMASALAKMEKAEIKNKISTFNNF